MKTKHGDVITFEPHRKSSLPIHRLVKEKQLSEVPAGGDHIYQTPDDLSIEEIEMRMQAEKFDVVKYLKNFKPLSCDPERLFSLARISKNHLQNSMKPETHSRNVFLNKNKRFLKSNYSGSSVLNIGHPDMTEVVEVGMHINN